MKILRSKFYLIRLVSANQNHAELVGGPFDKATQAAEHLGTDRTLLVVEGADLVDSEFRIDDKRPEGR